MLLVAAGCGVAAQTSGPDLRALVDNRQWFELRDAVDAANAPVFFHLVVSCVFDDVRRAEASLTRLIGSAAQSPDVFAAHGMLASAHMRAGHYSQVLSHLRAMQASRPDFGGLTGAIALFTALGAYPEPAVSRRRSSQVRMTEDMFLPVSIDERPANYGFDTGMDLSVMSETEARRLGLAIHVVAGSEFQDGASGIRTGIRFVIANRLLLGDFEIAHVPFLVVSREAMPFVELPADKQGILGYPVLRTFETIRWDRTRAFQVGFESASKRPTPNMCVPGNSTPVVDGRHGTRRITLGLDTGSSRTILTPRFARDFPGVVEQSAKKESTLLRGLGGSTAVDVNTLPELALCAGGFDFMLRPAQVLPPDPSVERDTYHVWAGMDILAQPRRITLDFRSMWFAAE